MTARVLVAGLGLIGGSFAKTLQAANRRLGEKKFEVLGLDRDRDVLGHALADGAIDRVADALGEADFAVLALPPRGIREFLTQRGGEFREDAIVLDVCGVKAELCDFVRELPGRRFCFFGCHPMAGREVSGYASSLPTLFLHASFAITRAEGLGQDEKKLADLKAMVRELGFEKIAEMSPETHDRVIAYTSQLCHVVSSAYVKSSALGEREGLTAGSFRDLSRVAYLDEGLWTELFLENREALLAQTEELIGNLTDYRDALKSGDTERLRSLLAEGRRLAEGLRTKRG